MRIVLVTGNYNHIPDGVSLTLNRLVRFLESDGNQVLIVAPTVTDPPINHAGRLIPVPSVSAPGREEYRLAFGLTDTVKQEILDFKPELIHIATPDITGIQALLLSIEFKIPAVSSYHTHFTSYLEYYKMSWAEPMLWAALRMFYRNCVHVYVPSASMIDSLKTHRIETDLRIWARGIDTDRFNPVHRDNHWRSELGIGKDQILVTFVSRLVWEKEMSTLRAVFNALHAASPLIKTMVVGDGPAAEELHATMPDTIFLGHQSGTDLSRAYASSDIFMFPSISETFGNVTLEAQASGVPVVAANAQGNKSLIDHGHNGYLVTPRDTAEFTDRILKLVNDGELRMKMSQNALIFAGNFTWDNIFSGLKQDYIEAVATYRYKTA